MGVGGCLLCHEVRYSCFPLPAAARPQPRPLLPTHPAFQWSHAYTWVPKDKRDSNMWLVGGVPGCRSHRQHAVPSRMPLGAPPPLDRWAQLRPAARIWPPRRSFLPHMTRGGRSRRGSSRGGEAPPAGPSAGPAAQPTPLGDVSNSARPAAARAAHKPPTAAAAARAAAVLPPPLPGLEDEEGVPAEPRGRLPVAQEDFEGFGDVLGCLR